MRETFSIYKIWSQEKLNLVSNLLMEIGATYLSENREEGCYTYSVPAFAPDYINKAINNKGLERE